MINKNLTMGYCIQEYNSEHAQDILSSYSRQISALQAYAWEQYQRRLVVISGEKSWGKHLAKKLLLQLVPQTLPQKQVLWIADQAVDDYPSINSQQAVQFLGQERDYLVYDAWDGFNPDAFGASCGIVRAGGLYLLLTPSLNEWQNYADPEHKRITVWPYNIEEVSTRFIKRLCTLIRHDKNICLIEQDKPQSFRRYIIGNTVKSEILDTKQTQTQSTPTANNPPEKDKVADNLEQGFLHDELSHHYQDQLKAIQAIIKTATGHRNRPSVLTADRGRGKSTALGIAAATLIEQGYYPILVTAPRRQATEALFRHACERSPKLCKKPEYLRFIAPDELVATQPPAHLVIVDEAAAIPSALLAKILHHYSRVTFATTVHGYEGTGRGFATRFQALLEKHTPSWKNIQLQQPIRWSEGDPLEAFSFRALLMNAQAAQTQQLQPYTQLSADDSEAYSVEKLNREQLAVDEHTLTELFGLLVLAHYQTRPLDLRHLLDGPNISVWVIRQHKHIIATALTAQEGPFDKTLSTAIYTGKRRPQGHLLPQSLSLHAGFQEASQLRYLRIIRIAVHPELQSQGLGKKLLTAIQNDAHSQNIDSLGTSYACSEKLLHFWHQAGYQTVRVGNKRDTTSGTYSVLMLKALSTDGTALFKRIQTRFHQQLPTLLSEPLKNLESPLAGLLLQQSANIQNIPPNKQDWLDCKSFANTHRDYAVCLPALKRLLRDAFAKKLIAKSELSTTMQQLLIRKLFQQQTWQTIVKQMNFKGKKQAIKALREAIAKILTQYTLD